MHLAPSIESTRARPHTSMAGFTLVEVLIAVVIMVVAMLGAVGTITQITILSEANRESTLAYQAARALVEEVQATPFEEVFQRYNNDPADDPDGAGTAEGMHFPVPGLNVQTADGDGFCGRVLLPVSAGTTLRENMVDDSFGLPRDLNGDGVVDGADHTDDKILLPIRIQVQWRGQSGDRTAEFSTVLGDRT